MTQMTTQAEVGVKDFTNPRKQRTLRFKLDDDVFEAPGKIAADVMIEFIDRYNSLSTQSSVQDQADAMRGMIKMVLFEGSRDRFIDRMKNPNEPIDLEETDAVVSWLMEEYGLRPTESSSGSSTSPPSQATTPSSTVLPPELESNSESSPPIAS